MLRESGASSTPGVGAKLRASAITGSSAYADDDKAARLRAGPHGIRMILRSPAPFSSRCWRAAGWNRGTNKRVEAAEHFIAGIKTFNRRAARSPDCNRTAGFPRRRVFRPRHQPGQPRAVGAGGAGVAGRRRPAVLQEQYRATRTLGQQPADAAEPFVLPARRHQRRAAAGRADKRAAIPSSAPIAPSAISGWSPISACR